MLKNTCETLTAGLRRHRAACLGLLAGLAALGLFAAARGNRAAMDWWLAHVSMPVKRGISALVDPLPFSACELGATVLIVGALAFLVRAIRRAVKGQKDALPAWLLHVAVLVVWGYAGVCALWGTQYYGTSFAGRAGMQSPAVSVEQLAAVTDYFAARVNETADAVPRDESGLFAVEKTEILQSCTGLYTPLLERWPFLDGPERHPKPAVYSKLMSAWGFTGYLCPLVGESTLNMDCPAVFLPVTVAHELAHQRGVAAEQEANFVGILAATEGGNAVYSYSGWLFGYLLLYTGCRRGEALALTYRDIDRKAGVIHIDKKVNYATTKPVLENHLKSDNGLRDIPLLPPLAEALPKNRIGLLFPGGDGGYMTPYEIMREWRHYCRDIGLNQIQQGENGETVETFPITPHCFRHSFATICYEAGLDPRQAAGLLGDTPEVVEAVYTHLRQDRRHTAAEKLTAYFSEKPASQL